VELSAFALGVVLGPSLDIKLAPPRADLTDVEPEVVALPLEPGRPESLRIRPGREVKRLPSLSGMRDPRQRGRILHALANHELQAAELYAWAILAYPEAPTAFRRDLLRILQEEQRHARMYISRLEACGQAFGDHPVTGYFWRKAEGLRGHPLRFVCAMALTFENANLDHTVDLEAAARDAGDLASAAVIRRVRADEVGHVAFGWRWLAAFKDPALTMWEAYVAQMQWPLRPALARGRGFNREDRLAAGLEPDFIRRLEQEASQLDHRTRRGQRGAEATAGR